jgi:glutamate decarboxylase
MLPKNPDGYPATEAFILRMVEVLLAYIKDTNDRDHKLDNFMKPDDLKKVFDCSISDEPADLAKLIADAETTLKYTVSCVI